MQAGQVETGLETLNQALKAAHQTGEYLYLAELYRLQGELLQHPKCNLKNRLWRSEDRFHKALNTASRQQAKSYELRAATSLARLWRDQDKCHDAYDLLAPVYGWFTEGFDTSDLQEAKALLEDLR